MSEVVDVLMAGNQLIPIVSDASCPKDILNRQALVDQILRLLDSISKTRGSCTFALNGPWGAGKTFVLDMVERQLKNYQDVEKYLVFHYNCWEYDYYDEPLVAVVAAMLDAINEDSHILSESARNAFAQGVAVAKPILEKIATAFVKNKIGVDISEIISVIKEGRTSAEEVAESFNEQHAYDQYYAFKNALSEAQKGLREIAAEKTIVVVVDEMDRCLPDYSIKVLERLHHLFYGIENVVVLLSIDRSQLENTIKQIFGNTTKPDTYLKKFISFELALDVGTITGGLTEKYADYVEMFDESLIETSFSIEDYFAALFAGIEIRTQERLMERIKTVHKMLFPHEKKEYSFMCFELMWLVFAHYHAFSYKMMIAPSADGFSLVGDILPVFSEYIKTNWREIKVREVHTLSSNSPTYFFVSPMDIPQMLIWYLHEMNTKKTIRYGFNEPTMNSFTMEKNLNEIKEVDKLLSIIR